MNQFIEWAKDISLLIVVIVGLLHLLNFILLILDKTVTKVLIWAGIFKDVSQYLVEKHRERKRATRK
jgi:hypothetical protein